MLLKQRCGRCQIWLDIGASRQACQQASTPKELVQGPETSPQQAGKSQSEESISNSSGNGLEAFGLQQVETAVNTSPHAKQ